MEYHNETVQCLHTLINYVIALKAVHYTEGRRASSRLAWSLVSAITLMQCLANLTSIVSHKMSLKWFLKATVGTVSNYGYNPQGGGNELGNDYDSSLTHEKMSLHVKANLPIFA